MAVRGPVITSVKKFDFFFLQQYNVYMERMQVLFGEPQLRELRRIAREKDRPVSELIRNAVDFWLSRNNRYTESEVAEAPPVYSCGKIKIEADRLREAAYEDRGLGRGLH